MASAALAQRSNPSSRWAVDGEGTLPSKLVWLWVRGGADRYLAIGTVHFMTWLPASKAWSSPRSNGGDADAGDFSYGSGS